MSRSLFALALLCVSSPALAESWNCKIPSLTGKEVTRWDVQGKDLIGLPSGFDYTLGPRLRFKILTNSDRGLIAYKSNEHPNENLFNIVTISKPDGKIQWRLSNIGNEYEERYEGICQPAK